MAAVARRVHADRDDALVIAESGLNDPRVMRDRAVGGWGCDAAWADDFHHSLRTLVTGELDGYYADFGSVARARQGLAPPVRATTAPTRRFRRRRFGAPADDVPPERFVVFDQNHDQVGNRAFGDRLPPPARPLAAFCTLLSPLRPDAVHGRGVRRERAVSVLLGPHRRGRSRRPRARAAARSSRRSPRSQARRFPTRRTRATFERSKLTRAARPRARRAVRRAAARRVARLPPGDVDASSSTRTRAGCASAAARSSSR